MGIKGSIVFWICGITATIGAMHYGLWFVPIAAIIGYGAGQWIFSRER